MIMASADNGRAEERGSTSRRRRQNRRRARGTGGGRGSFSGSQSPAASLCLSGCLLDERERERRRSGHLVPSAVEQQPLGHEREPVRHREGAGLLPRQQPPAQPRGLVGR